MNHKQKNALLVDLELLREDALKIFHKVKGHQQPFDEPRATIVSILGKLDGAILNTRHMNVGLYGHADKEAEGES